MTIIQSNAVVSLLKVTFKGTSIYLKNDYNVCIQQIKL